MTPTKHHVVLGLALFGLGLFGCESLPLVATDGALLTIAANPLVIAVDGSSTITITASHADGTPVSPGTEIVLTTTLGSIPAIVTADRHGLAHAVLTGEGSAGTATVTAHSGGAAAATVEVELAFPVGGLTAAARPTRFERSGGAVTLLATVFDDRGQPLTDAALIFTTSAGSLDAGGRVVRSDGRGEASDVLRLTAAEAQALAGTTITVTVVARSGGAERTVTVAVAVAG